MMKHKAPPPQNPQQRSNCGKLNHFSSIINYNPPTLLIFALTRPEGQHFAAVIIRAAYSIAHKVYERQRELESRSIVERFSTFFSSCNNLGL
ncbi:hypothetical protein ACFOWX_05140 [Sphingorhabdus arenilitoris]|uniref:Uncharacterized protein n=1 Tax=Sphingorhabdus arenilitoris TaxID=1490041 RepID=A0ABV8RFZ6_9SPHN